MVTNRAAWAIQQRARDLKRIAESEVHRTLYRGVDLARRQSSGPYSLVQLARMGHPYARRHGTALLPPGKINAQTGKFRASWRADRLGPYKGRIINDNFVADFLQFGTDKMLPRPVGLEVEQMLTKELSRRLQKEINAWTR
jgi:hypothetical protein